MYIANPTMDMPCGPSSSNTDLAYYILAENIEDKFPEGASTLRQIYSSVTSPLGLTPSESNSIVKRAIKAGYLIKV